MTKQRTAEDEACAEGFHDLPSQKERAAMTVLQLAELLSRRERGSPVYILIEYELNLKIAKTQAKATLSSGWIGLLGSFLAVLTAFALGYFTGERPAKEAGRAESQAIKYPLSSPKPQLQPITSPELSVIPESKTVATKPDGSNNQKEQNVQP